jgi:hypothetical protein
MTPKEKAEELIWKYLPLIEGWTAPKKTDLAKKLALICVDELIELYEFEVPHRGFKISYWDEVKQEIEKL